MAETEVRFASTRLSTGVRLHWAERGDPEGPAILFLHGWPDSWFSFSRVLPFIPARQRVLAIDQRGFGDSDRPGSGYGIRDLAADAIAYLDALAIDRASIVGHSYGSFVARRAAIAHPSRVDRLVMLGSGFTGANPVLRGLQADLRDIPDPIPPEFAREFQASTAYRPLPPEFFDRIVAESLKLPAWLWPEMIDRLLEYDDAEELGGIRSPTLLLWGDHDALFPRSDQDRLLEAIPRARLTVYEDTGHCPNWERPERVARDIAAFVEED